MGKKEKIKALYGFIDKSGKMVIETDFDGMQPFSCGVTLVQVGSKWGVLTRLAK